MLRAREFGLLSLVFLLLSCQGSDGDENGSCEPGSLNCECVQEQLCLGSLECNAGVCVASDETGNPGDGDPGDGDPGDGDPGDGDPGDGDPGDGDPVQCNPPEVACDGTCVDPMTSNDHCGACGNACIINLDEGGCVEGVCAPTWSSCAAGFPPPAKSCDEVCAQDGMQCAPQSCGVASVYWFGTLGDCEEQFGGTFWGNNDCAVAIADPSDDTYRCCCQQ